MIRLDDDFKIIPTSREAYIIEGNVRGFDMMFENLVCHCAAPDCLYPLRNDGDNYTLPGIGDVCNVCFVMYTVVQVRQFFVDAQRQMNEVKKRRKERGDRND